MRNKLKLEIIHEDSALVLINKPAGMLSVPDRFDGKLVNAKHLLRQQYGEIYAVHRLDRDTSGIMCFARTKEAHRALSTQFSEHQPEKKYLALTEGVVSADEGEIDSPLQEDPRRPGKMMVASKGGLMAFTKFQVVERFADYTWVSVEIQSGRTHQIRVHMQSIGHSVVADPLYSRRSSLLLSTIKGRKYRLGKEKEERPLLARTALHATSLGLQHPDTGDQIVYTVDPPKDIRASLQQLRKWNPSR